MPAAASATERRRSRDIAISDSPTEAIGTSIASKCGNQRTMLMTATPPVRLTVTWDRAPEVTAADVLVPATSARVAVGSVLRDYQRTGRDDDLGSACPGILVAWCQVAPIEAVVIRIGNRPPDDVRPGRHGTRERRERDVRG